MIYLLEDDGSIRDFVIYTLRSQGMEARGFALPSAFWTAMIHYNHLVHSIRRTAKNTPGSDWKLPEFTAGWAVPAAWGSDRIP